VLWRLVGIVAGGTLVRAVIAAHFPIHFDEAYYWLWAHRPDWGYVDQPPMIAYLILLTTLLGDATTLVRLSALLLGAATSYVLFLLGREMFDDRVGLLAAALFQIVPILMFGGVIAAPEAPLYLAWVLALRFSWHALHGRPARWAAVGLAVGLGILSKFSMLWLGVGVVLYTVLEARPWLRRNELYQAALIAVVLFLPVGYWNVHHDWANIRFVLHDRPRPHEGLSGFQPFWLTLPYLVFLTPAYVLAFWTMLRRTRDERFRYLLLTSLPAVAFPILVAPWGMARGHWWGPVYLELSIVVAALWNPVTSVMAACNALVLAWAVALVLVGLPRVPPLSLLYYLYGWDGVAQRVERELGHVGEGAVVVTDDYEIASALSYYGRLKFQVLLAGSTDPAAVWPRFADARGSDGVGVTRSPYPWDRCFRRNAEMPPQAVQLYRHVRVFRLYHLFAPCSDPGQSAQRHARSEPRTKRDATPVERGEIAPMDLSRPDPLRPSRGLGRFAGGPAAEPTLSMVASSRRQRRRQIGRTARSQGGTGSVPGRTNTPLRPSKERPVLCAYV
jgi:dolichyl-phosphate-mannose-protein mannosyltransferase